MYRGRQPLAGGEEPFGETAPRCVVADRHNHRVVWVVLERVDRTQDRKTEQGGAEPGRRVVDEADRLRVRAGVAPALQDVGDDGTVRAGAHDDDSTGHLRYGSAVIPLSSPDVDDDDVRLVTEVLRSGYLASGPVAEQFEREFAASFGARFAVAASSGTAALHMAVIAAGVTGGDLVVTSPYSFVASANAILYERGIPVFVDVDPDTLTIDPEKAIEALRDLALRRRGWRALLPRAARDGAGVLRAVLPVHLFGCPADVRGIVAAARELGIAVIEDACEALRARVDGEWAGRWGDAAAFGFYPNKQITTGEGGMLLTDRQAWADQFRSLRNQGRSAGAWLRYERLGFNYRMDELSAALGLSQFRRLERLLARRKDVADRYTARLAGIDGVTPLAESPGRRTRTWFLYAIRLAPQIDRDALIEGLAARGIMSRPYFWPIHLQPFYVQRFGFAAGDFPAAEAAGRSMVALPMSPNLTDAEIDAVCAAVAEEVSTRAAC